MKKFFIWIFIITFLLISACSPKGAPETIATVPPTLIPSTTITVLPTTSQTHSPTITHEPTLTPSNTPVLENLLSKNGPWLMYRHMDGSVNFVNQDGTGKTKASYFIDDNAILFPSPSQNFLTSIKSTHFEDLNRFTSLVTVYEIPDFSTLITIDLYSYLFDDPMKDNGNDEIIGGSGWAWSPNGRFLAFSAAIDGPSLDLYVYDTLTNQVNRLTSGENHVGHMHWSPNSQWIVHEEVLSFTGWTVESMWAAAVDGSDVIWLYQPDHRDSQRILGWLDSYRFVTIGSSATGLQTARLTNLYSNESIILYPGAFAASGPVLAPDLEIIAFNTAGDGTLPFEENGLYIIDLNTPALRLVSYDDQITIYDENSGYFMTYTPCQDEENGFSGQLGFKSDGILTCVAPQSFSYYQDVISPDGKWTLNFEYEKFSLLNEHGDTILTERGVDYEAYWRFDSAGFFLLSQNDLYYVPIDSPQLTLIDNQLGFSDIKYDNASPEWIGEKKP